VKLLTQGRLALAACVLALGLLSGGAYVYATSDAGTARALVAGGLAACVVAMALTQGVIGRLHGWLDEARDRQAGAKA
jgi:hypothetical protein